MLTEQTKNYHISNREITLGTGNKRIGMYLGEQYNPACKECKNILITSAASKNFRDTILVITKELYKRNVYKDGQLLHKKGDNKQKKILKIRPFMTIRNAWESAFDYPTVSYGLNCFRREVLIIDSDVEYDSLEKLESIVKEFCLKVQIPMASYIIRNPKTEHGQIGWFLDNPFENTDFIYNLRNFNLTIRRLSNVWSMITGFDADFCFNGPACKNPFYKDFESIIYNELPINRNDFIQKLGAISSYYTPPSTFYSDNKPVTNGKNKPIRITIQRTKKQIEKRMFDSENGRNCYLMEHLRTFVFKFMNKNNGVSPDYNTTFEAAKQIAKETAEHFGKGTEEFGNIKNTVKSVRNWCIENYDSSYAKKGTDTSSARAKSILVKKCNKLINAIDALNGKIEVNKRTLYRYKAMSESDWKDLLESRKEFLSYFRSIKENCQIMELSFDGYLLLEERLNNIDLTVIHSYYTPPSSVYSDNTSVTNKSEETKMEKEPTEEGKDIIELRKSIEDVLDNPCTWYSRMNYKIWSKYAEYWFAFQKTDTYKKVIERTETKTETKTELKHSYLF